VISALPSARKAMLHGCSRPSATSSRRAPGSIGTLRADSVVPGGSAGSAGAVDATADAGAARTADSTAEVMVMAVGGGQGT